LIPVSTTTSQPQSTTITSSTTTLRPTTTLPVSFYGYTHDVRGRDISIRRSRGTRTKFWNTAYAPWEQPLPIRTATQPERAMMYLMGVAKMMPEGLLYARENPYCVATAWSPNLGNYETENKRLRAYYIDPNRNDVWAILGGNGPPDYEHVQDLGEDIQRCSLQSEAAQRACASSPYMTTDMLEWTDMRIVDGRCRFGADLIFQPDPVEDLRIANMGKLDYRVALPPLTSANIAALNAVMASHHQSDVDFCHGVPASVSVSSAVRSLYRTAISEEQFHSFLLVFTGRVDNAVPKGWTRQQLCDGKMFEGFAMHEWGRAFFDFTGVMVWQKVTPRRAAHETVHNIVAMREATHTYRIPDGSDRQLTDQTARTGADWLRCITGELAGCRPLWVPDPSTWRIMVP
jgi:hypothetical protein